jgi:hypothetical protein
LVDSSYACLECIEQIERAHFVSAQEMNHLRGGFSDQISHLHRASKVSAKVEMGHPSDARRPFNRIGPS